MESTKFPPDMFGAPAMSFSATKRLGNDQSRMAQIQNGRWMKVTDYLTVPPEK
jgi:branched-chain amino acid transport system substrate-binding protein